MESTVEVGQVVSRIGHATELARSVDVGQHDDAHNHQDGTGKAPIPPGATHTLGIGIVSGLHSRTVPKGKPSGPETHEPDQPPGDRTALGGCDRPLVPRPIGGCLYGRPLPGTGQS